MRLPHGISKIHFQRLYRSVSDIAGLFVPDVGAIWRQCIARSAGWFGGPESQRSSGDINRAGKLPGSGGL